MAYETTTFTKDLVTQIAAELEPVLAELVDLSLQGKQAHWNVVGPNFMPLHAQFDKLVDDTRAWADEVAERMVAVGTPASGQVLAVAECSALERLPGGSIPDREAVALMADRVAAVAARSRTAMERLGDLDPVSQDILIEIVEGLEKHLWMLRAQQA